MYATDYNGNSATGGPYTIYAGGPPGDPTPPTSSDTYRPTISLQGVTVSGGTSTISGTGTNITKDDYGGVVTNYNPANGVDVGWKIYHTDGNYIPIPEIYNIFIFLCFFLLSLLIQFLLKLFTYIISLYLKIYTLNT